MALQRVAYQPRDAQHTVLRQITALHLEAFLGVAAEPATARLPQFVESESREFLTCGVIELGVARFRCESYAHEHLLPLRHLRPRALGRPRCAPTRTTSASSFRHRLR